MAILCSYCEKEMDKMVFCSTKCRVYSHRGIKPVTIALQKSPESVTQALQKEPKKIKTVTPALQNDKESVTEALQPVTISLQSVTPALQYDHLPNRFKPALSWRDDKGQCQHKLKMCQLCQ